MEGGGWLFWLWMCWARWCSPRRRSTARSCGGIAARIALPGKRRARRCATIIGMAANSPQRQDGTRHGIRPFLLGLGLSRSGLKGIRQLS